MGRVSAGPLDGLRVLDFTHVLAGPFATRIMGDLGADIVKVGSLSRPGNVPGDGTADSPMNAYYTMWNRNKRSLALDMGSEQARAVCRTLCERADIVIENFSVGVLDRWGVGYEAVSESAPGVIYIAMSGVGTGGPWSDFVTFAPTIHAISGLTYLTGVPDHEPIGIGTSHNDHLAGLHATVAALSAIEARRESGRGQLIDLSQFEVGVNLNGIALFDYFANGRSAEPAGNRRPYDVVAPHNTYQCAGDDRWVAIVATSDEQWGALRSVLGAPAWAAEPRFETAAGRVANIDDLDAGISAWTAELAAEDVQTRCQAAGVPAGVVQDGGNLVERDPQLRHLGFFRATDDDAPEGVPMPIDALPLHFSRTPVPRYRAHRALGADTADVLSEWASMSADEIAAGEASGAFS
jgi:crotonobetainyl-CoA:carnitine CoA-transferase CaiB-like acyl-CoA transferase